MRSLKTREAAALLNVSTNTLRTWERKFDYPRPLRSPGRHRAYVYSEIVALRDALRRGLSVASAISAVREGWGADTDALVDALEAFNPVAADRAMEASLALRSMERSVGEVLLPALDDIRRQDGAASANWAIASGWACDWLSRAQRLLRPADTGIAILIGDASGGAIGPAAARIHALELFCRQAGIEVLLLPVTALSHLDEAVAIFEPVCALVAGGHASDEQVGRWMYAVQHMAGELSVALYLRPTKDSDAAGKAPVLPPAPIDAQRGLLELVVAARGAKRVIRGGEANRLAQSG